MPIRDHLREPTKDDRSGSKYTLQYLLGCVVDGVL
jgi:hypothetical protein